MNKQLVSYTALLLVLGGCSVTSTSTQTEQTAIRPVAEGTLQEDERAAVRRALPYLAGQTGTWIEQKKCTSCHQVPHALWAMNDARGAGFVVDDRLTKWNRWSVDFVLREMDKPEGMETRARERADEAYQILLSGCTDDVVPNTDSGNGPANARSQLISLLHLGQDGNGYWEAGGQLPGQKRPMRETNEVTTMWSLLALRASGNDADKAKITGHPVVPKVEPQSTSIEHLALRYILALERETDEQSSALQLQILAHQNNDGGWGWLLHGPSDALGTGQALYALSYMAPEHRHDATRRAHQYLLQTQQPDGSWHVPSTLARKDNQPTEVSNDWGTAWALIGMLRTMGR